MGASMCCGMAAELMPTCKEIVRLLMEIDTPTAGDARRITKQVCARMSPQKIPKKQEILAAAAPAEYRRLRQVLMTKPIKTGSGVAVIALMPKPYACPHGRCTYCPGGVEVNTPNSYTGNEPSTLNAIKHRYDPYKQITTKLKQLISYGHSPTKMELVIVGGTFLFMPKSYRTDFIKSCYDALNGRVSATLKEAMNLNAISEVRNVGFTIETKPDYCKRRHVDTMLDYGVTRVEIGVQSLQEETYRVVNRGHTYSDVLESFQAARDAGLKIVAHMMPGLPGSSPDADIADFKRLFADPALRPDMLKIYPALVLENTPLHSQYIKGVYRPYTQDEAVQVMATIKAEIPRWVRINRVQREISYTEIVAGPHSGNLRQLIFQEMKRRGTCCSCIRCREPNYETKSDLTLERLDYEASGGHETFLSYVDAQDRIYGFLRLRKPSFDSHRPETRGACIVRELHVYGRLLDLGTRGGIQHSGLGRRLLAEAERISETEMGATRVIVTSAVGTREYYAMAGYLLYGPYMAKTL